LQEETLQLVIVQKEVLKCHEKKERTREQVNYIMEIQNGRNDEEHDIGVLVEEGHARIQRSLDYWREMSSISKAK
jgi:hypothetical protein